MGFYEKKYCRVLNYALIFIFFFNVSTAFAEVNKNEDIEYEVLENEIAGWKVSIPSDSKISVHEVEFSSPERSYGVEQQILIEWRGQELAIISNPLESDFYVSDWLYANTKNHNHEIIKYYTFKNNSGLIIAGVDAINPENRNFSSYATIINNRVYQIYGFGEKSKSLTNIVINGFTYTGDVENINVGQASYGLTQYQKFKYKNISFDIPTSFEIKDQKEIWGEKNKSNKYSIKEAHHQDSSIGIVDLSGSGIKSMDGFIEEFRSYLEPYDVIEKDDISMAISKKEKGAQYLSYFYYSEKSDVVIRMKSPYFKDDKNLLKWLRARKAYADAILKSDE